MKGKSILGFRIRAKFNVNDFIMQRREIIHDATVNDILSFSVNRKRVGFFCRVYLKNGRFLKQNFDMYVD